MSLSAKPGLPTRRTLGLSYLASVGALLAAGLVGYGLTTADSQLTVVLTLGLGLVLFGTLVYVAYVFEAIEIGDSLIWTVAEWTALGIAVATLVSVAIAFAYRFLATATMVPGLLAVTITAGGLVGALVGSVTSLREQHSEVGNLTQRNAVLNRVLRHNIKNDMNVIIGHASLLDQEIDGETTGSVEAIHRAASDVTRLSEAARTIDKLGTAPESSEVDLVRIVRQSVDSADSFYPEATIEADLPSSAWVEASPLVGTVVANLLKNAVEHNTDDPTVEVVVETPDGDGTVELAVTDDGPGIYEDERAVLEAGEDPITHGSGMGLWLVKWFAQAYDGDLRFEDNDPQGSIVQLALPAADGPVQEGGNTREAAQSPIHSSDLW